MLSMSSAVTSAYAMRTPPPTMMAVVQQPQSVTDAQNKLLKRPAAWKPQEVAPDYLTGALAGDNGFDPLCLVALAKPSGLDIPLNIADREQRMEKMSPEDAALAVMWMREAELKHARLAMLAAAGWPLAELFNQLLGGWALSETGGRAPSVLNGGLVPMAPFLVLAAAGAAFLEMKKAEDVKQAWPGGMPAEYIAGDYGFDPLDICGEEGAFFRRKMQASELFNGRLAMLAITGYAMQEFLYGTPVVEQTPFFFGN